MTAFWCSCSWSLSGTLAAAMIHRFASNRLRRAPAWDCGYPDPNPATQYSAMSFAQPIRRVFGSIVFQAREAAGMPPPGDTQPAWLKVELHDPVWEYLYAPLAAANRPRRRPSQPSAVSHHPPVSHARIWGAGHSPSGGCRMVLIRDLAIQGAQMLLVLLLAPLFTGFVRKAKARLLRRQGPPLIQPYRDLLRLTRKDVVLAENASWLFRVVPYLVFAATWVAASLVPTFRTGLLFSWSADLIAIIALLGSAQILSRACRSRCRHELWRHRFEPRGDARVPCRTGDDHGRVHFGAGRRLDPAFHHRRLHELVGCRAPRIARARTRRAHHGGDRRE